ncbi:MAG: mandelate racemase/muconate lactonizing enzyme family protein [Acidobacteria bacterium]|nr:mandelate racemase/muconate lactonizing enzyme family protein [Acidobacteriota bacterium]
MIQDLRAWPLREPVSGRRYTVIRLTTDSGTRGYGECGTASAADRAEARRLVVGQSATAFEPVRQRLTRLPQLQAAVNIALLDISGQLARAPLYQVLGGPTRHKARVMTALAGDSDDALVASLRRARQAGYLAFLVPLPPRRTEDRGQAGASTRDTLASPRFSSQAFVLAVKRRLEALRAAGGDETDLVLDGAGRLTPGDAASLSQALERFHLLWFDEPCPLSNLAAVRKLAAENVTPLGFGREIHEAGLFQDLLREDAIDVLRPSLALNGVTQIRKMAAIAETYYVAVAPFHDGGPIGTAAALHLAASLPNFFIQQVPLPEAEEDRRMRAELCSNWAETARDGCAELPAGPGLGISVSEAALEKYQERAR